MLPVHRLYYYFTQMTLEQGIAKSAIGVAPSLLLPFLVRPTVSNKLNSKKREFTFYLLASLTSLAFAYKWEDRAWRIQLAVVGILGGHRMYQSLSEKPLDTLTLQRLLEEQRTAIQKSIDFAEALPAPSNENLGIWTLKTIKNNMAQENPYDSMTGSEKDTVEFFYSAHDTGKNAAEQCPLPTGMPGSGKIKGDFACFANTFAGEVEYGGQVWRSREHAFQAQKFKKGSKTYQMIQQGEWPFCSAGQLRKSVKEAKYAEDLRITAWDQWNDERIPIMAELNYNFFKKHLEHQATLLGTSCCPIVEHNRVPDEWGISFENPNLDEDQKGRSVNLNYQGTILMQVRRMLQKEALIPNR